MLWRLVGMADGWLQEWLGSRYGSFSARGESKRVQSRAACHTDVLRVIHTCCVSYTCAVTRPARALPPVGEGHAAVVPHSLAELLDLSGLETAQHDTRVRAVSSAHTRPQLVCIFYGSCARITAATQPISSIEVHSSCLNVC